MAPCSYVNDATTREVGSLLTIKVSEKANKVAFEPLTPRTNSHTISSCNVRVEKSRKRAEGQRHWREEARPRGDI